MSRVVPDDQAVNDLLAYIQTFGHTPGAERVAARDDAEEDFPMAYVAIADRDHALHDPQTFIRKYIWSQDHKVIAIQYAVTAIGIGLVALGLSVLMRLQLGFPHAFSLIAPNNYLQFITMHGMIMVIYLLTALFLGGFGNYLIPLMCGARDMVFPYMNMLSDWVTCLPCWCWWLAFCAGRAHGRRLDSISPAGGASGHSGSELGNHFDVGVPGNLHRGVHHGRVELRDHGPAGPLSWHDLPAHALVRLGHSHGHHPGDCWPFLPCWSAPS